MPSAVTLLEPLKEDASYLAQSPLRLYRLRLPRAGEPSSDELVLFFLDGPITGLRRLWPAKKLIPSSYMELSDSQVNALLPDWATHAMLSMEAIGERLCGCYPYPLVGTCARVGRGDLLD